MTLGASVFRSCHLLGGVSPPRALIRNENVAGRQGIKKHEREIPRCAQDDRCLLGKRGREGGKAAFPSFSLPSPTLQVYCHFEHSEKSHTN